jgi:hypothetical protein
VGSCEHDNEHSVPKNGGKVFFLVEQLLTSQEGLRSTEVVINRQQFLLTDIANQAFIYLHVPSEKFLQYFTSDTYNIFYSQPCLRRCPKVIP